MIFGQFHLGSDQWVNDITLLTSGDECVRWAGFPC